MVHTQSKPGLVNQRSRAGWLTALAFGGQIWADHYQLCGPEETENFPSVNPALYRKSKFLLPRAKVGVKPGNTHKTLSKHSGRQRGGVGPEAVTLTNSHVRAFVSFKFTMGPYPPFI